VNPTPNEKKEVPGVLRGNLRRHFLTGLLVVTPTVVAGWVLYRLFVFVDNLLWDYIRFGWIKPGGIPGVGAVAVLALVFLIGVIVNNYLGRRIYNFWESLVIRIPLFNKIYIAVKQIGEALLSRDKNVFRAVGLIEYPRHGLYSLVFITEAAPAEIQDITGQPLRSVFLPTTPNPTSGFLLMVPESQITILGLSVEEGLKMVISGGAYVPDVVALEDAQRAPARRRRWRLLGRRSDVQGPAVAAEPVDDDAPGAGDETPDRGA